MKIKIVSNFHVFVPNGERDRKVALVAGSVLGTGDMPEGHSARDWVEKGLAEEVGGASVAERADDDV